MDGTQSSEWFSKHNAQGFNRREKLALDTLCAALDFLLINDGRVAVFDATNTTVKRRDWVYSLIKSYADKGVHCLFVESMFSKQDLVHQNVMEKLDMSPDWIGVQRRDAELDMWKRIRNYEIAYQPVHIDEGIPFVQLIDFERAAVLNIDIAQTCPLVKLSLAYICSIHNGYRNITFQLHSPRSRDQFEFQSFPPSFALPQGDLAEEYLATRLSNLNQECQHQQAQELDQIGSAEFVEQKAAKQLQLEQLQSKIKLFWEPLHHALFPESTSNIFIGSDKCRISSSLSCFLLSRIHSLMKSVPLLNTGRKYQKGSNDLLCKQPDLSLEGLSQRCGKPSSLSTGEALPFSKNRGGYSCSIAKEGIDGSFPETTDECNKGGIFLHPDQRIFQSEILSDFSIACTPTGSNTPTNHGDDPSTIPKSKLTGLSDFLHIALAQPTADVMTTKFLSDIPESETKVECNALISKISSCIEVIRHLLSIEASSHDTSIYVDNLVSSEERQTLQDALHFRNINCCYDGCNAGHSSVDKPIDGFSGQLTKVSSSSQIFSVSELPLSSEVLLSYYDVQGHIHDTVRMMGTATIRPFHTEGSAAWVLQLNKSQPQKSTCGDVSSTDNVDTSLSSPYMDYG